GQRETDETERQCQPSLAHPCRLFLEWCDSSRAALVAPSRADRATHETDDPGREHGVASLLPDSRTREAPVAEQPEADAGEAGGGARALRRLRGQQLAPP